MTDSTTVGDGAITRFFRDFERRTASTDAAAQAAQFADTFLAAGPQGAQCVRAVDFALALPKRKALFDKLGCRSTELASLEEIFLDARYTLVRTRWRMKFEQPDRDPQDLLVSSVFIVDTGGLEFKILLYLANQDIMSVLKDRGMLVA